MIHCNKCNIDKNLSEFYTRTNGIMIKPCKECTKKRVKKNNAETPIETKREKWNEWSKSNREHLNDYSKNYRETHQEIVCNIASNYRNSKKDDKQYINANSLRKKLRYYVIQNPSDTYIDLFGASSNFVRSWIEFQFSPEMNWDNYGKYWNFDHITPYDNFDLTIEDQQLKCCIWSNIQPLPYSKNSGKKNKIDLDLIEEKKNLAHKFKQEF